MIKTFLILLIFPILLFSSQQIVLVVADDFTTSQAKLYFYEDTKQLYSIQVNIGRNGLAWGLGERNFAHKKGDPIKYEGDGKAPAGVFKLTNIFGYGYNENFKLPFLHTSKELICVDDSRNNFYNQIIQKENPPKSFEYMRRDDHQYKYGVTVEHNKGKIAKRGSCIFLHIQKAHNSPTSGCTSMKEEDLYHLIKLLNKNKNPLLIQITKASLAEVIEAYKINFEID
jgi:L,D-peptidoglycan transpeptidase YkuD (ErfK/YbiS/YcfS/YnhG family)